MASGGMIEGSAKSKGYKPRFASARLKRILQSDEDVGRVAVRLILVNLILAPHLTLVNLSLSGHSLTCVFEGDRAIY